jgi:hypothetical protein
MAAFQRQPYYNTKPITSLSARKQQYEFENVSLQLAAWPHVATGEAAQQAVATPTQLKCMV